MKHLPALFTALVITTVIGLGILVIGVNALTNTNTVALQNSPNSSITANDPANNNANTGGSSATASSDVQQLQQQVSALQSQLDQANQTIQQYQSLLSVLQQREIIHIDQNGNIYLPEGSESVFH